METNLNNYSVAPDPEQFEQIERRLQRRRWSRVGLSAAVALLLGASVWLLVAPHNDKPEPEATTLPAVGELPATPAQPAETVSEVLKSSEAARTASPRQASEKQQLAVQEQPASVAPSVPQNLPSTATAVATADRQEPIVPSPEPVVLSEDMAVVESADRQIPSSEAEPAVVPIKADNQGNPQGNAGAVESLLWAPNAIAPADEIEKNRYFKLSANGEISNFQLYIYNRGGRQVFSSTDINQRWDATVGGTPLPQGSYVWVARYRDAQGVLHQDKGTVTVIR